MVRPTGSLFGTLRGRIILSVALVHAVMMALFVVDLTLRQRGMLLERQVEQATALSRALAVAGAGWIAAADVSGLQELVEAQRGYPEVVFAMLADRDGRVLAHLDRTKVGLYLEDLPPDARPVVLARTAELVDIAVPASIAGHPVGWARVGVSQVVAGKTLDEITRNGVVYVLTAILLGALIAWFMGVRVTGRLRAVQATFEAVRAGDRLARARLSGGDEAATLARDLNVMLDALTDGDAKVRASEQRFQSLIDKVQTAIVLHDAQGRTLEANPMAQRLLGLSSDQLLGRALVDERWHFLRGDGTVLPVAEYPVAQVLSTGAPVRGLVAGISMPERTEATWVLVNAEPTCDASGRLELVIVSFVDVTALRQAEAALRESEQQVRRLNQELEQRVASRTALLEAANQELEGTNKELEAFAYSVSHDLRAPLRHIDGYVGLLRRKLESHLDDDARRYMATISQASRHMGTLIDDLLAFSRQGRQRLAATRVDLSALAREVVDEASADVRARVVHWHVGELPVVTGDRAMLRVVFVNLISNALKFTVQRAEAEIALGSTTGPGGEAVVFVRDNGVGFDMAYVHKLFGVFERLHAEFEGTGIGLANVRRIVERHGGRCWAEGRVGQGATFFFSLPAVAGPSRPVPAATDSKGLGVVRGPS